MSSGGTTARHWGFKMRSRLTLLVLGVLLGLLLKFLLGDWRPTRPPKAAPPAPIGGREPLPVATDSVPNDQLDAAGRTSPPVCPD